MEEKTIVSIHNLVKRYGDVLALDHLDLETKRGGDIRPFGAKWVGKDHGHQLPSGSPWI